MDIDKAPYSTPLRVVEPTFMSGMIVVKVQASLSILSNLRRFHEYPVLWFGDPDEGGDEFHLDPRLSSVSLSYQFELAHNFSFNGRLVPHEGS